MKEFCKSCQKDVTPVPEDIGIGSYEFWGQRGVQSEIVMVCPECDEALELSYFDWKENQDDLAADYKADLMEERRFLYGEE
jgi:hypothetical protein